MGTSAITITGPTSVTFTWGSDNTSAVFNASVSSGSITNMYADIPPPMQPYLQGQPGGTATISDDSLQLVLTAEPNEQITDNVVIFAEDDAGNTQGRNCMVTINPASQAEPASITGPSGTTLTSGTDRTTQSYYASSNDTIQSFTTDLENTSLDPYLVEQTVAWSAPLMGAETGDEQLESATNTRTLTLQLVSNPPDKRTANVQFTAVTARGDDTTTSQSSLPITIQPENAILISVIDPINLYWNGGRDAVINVGSDDPIVSVTTNVESTTLTDYVNNVSDTLSASSSTGDTTIAGDWSTKPYKQSLTLRLTSSPPASRTATVRITVTTAPEGTDFSTNPPPQVTHKTRDVSVTISSDEELSM